MPKEYFVIKINDLDNTKTLFEIEYPYLKEKEEVIFFTNINIV